MRWRQLHGYFAATVDPGSCTVQFITAEGTFGSESIINNAFNFTLPDSECGTITGSGVIQGNTMMGSYEYSGGGDGTFSGTKASRDLGGNTNGE